LPPSNIKKTMKALSVVDQGIIKSLNQTVSDVLSSTQLEAFDKAFKMAHAIQTLRSLLTKEVMEPIMSLQGSQLGFKTDKDKDGGYPLAKVTDCMITATLMGVMPTGNQFNIIAGNTYITKEGYEYLLSKVEGLRFKVTHDLPRVQTDKAAIVMHIEWSLYGGPTEKISQDFPIKSNSFVGADGVIGKGKRKAYNWLYAQVTGVNLPEGDVNENVGKTTIIHNEKDRFKAMLDAEYESAEQFQNDVLNRAGEELLEEFSFEIAEKLEILKSKGGSNE
jgi:hypothetical protein